MAASHSGVSNDDIGERGCDGEDLDMGKVTMAITVTRSVDSGNDHGGRR